MAKQDENKNIASNNKLNKKLNKFKEELKEELKEEIEDIKETKEELKEELNELKEELTPKKEQSNIVSLIELVGIILAIVIILIFFPGTVVWNIVVLLLILSILIFVHEFGHYITGKMFGVHIYEFALGMGPKILGFKRKNDPTEYTLRAFPIGGFCALAGEEGEDDENLPKDKFLCNKPKLQKIIVLIAGVTMNFITAIVILFITFAIWGTTNNDSYVHTIEKGSPAEEAGIVVGDKIVELNGYKISNWDKLSIVGMLKHKGDFEYVIEHKDGSKDTYKIKPAEYILYKEKYIRVTKENTKENIMKEHNIKAEELQVVEIIGIGQNPKIEKGFVVSLKNAFKEFVSIVDIMLLTVGTLITGKLGLDALSGPVGMYTVVETVSAVGFANILYLMAYLSVNLGVINILPFPAFDGGRCLFIIIEAIIGKKIPPKVENAIHNIGFILILILMLYITFQDILRFF